MNDDDFEELLRLKDGTLFHRETQTLEFKEQFNLAGLADYFRDFAAFANNKGGKLVFGIKDKPRVPIGLNEKSRNQFESIDPEKITGFILEIFSCSIDWKQYHYQKDGKYFGVFEIKECRTKPVIAKKDEGKDNSLKNGEIYFRYGGRTQKIMSAELESIINSRIEATNQAWIDHVTHIGRDGPSNSITLKAMKDMNAHSGASFFVDNDLANRIKFIREGEFKETEGAEALKLVGDLVPVDSIEVEKIVAENVHELYPFAAKQLAKEVQSRCQGVKQNTVWSLIKAHKLKFDPAYSTFIFTNKRNEKKYIETGQVSEATPSVYNQAAIDLICKLAMEQD
ncbi:MAG: ATP-binding protein [Pseudomonadota bacterium]